MSEITKEKSNKTTDETKRLSKKIEDINVHNQSTNEESSFTPHIKYSASIKSNKSDKSFVPQVPPRGISKIHMKNRLKRNVKSEDNLCKINIPKPVKNNDNNTNSFSTFLLKNENLKSLDLPKNIKSEEEFNVYLKRKYRESKIKILYRNDYYMQELDDKDYDDYDKALFDEQLFINVENNETECSDTLINEPSSPSLSNIFDLTSPSFPKDDTTASLIAQGYQHIVEKNEKNLKETSLVGEQDKKHRSKYHHYGATNDSYDLDSAPARSVSLSSIQTISKSKLNIYPKNRSLSTSNLKSSTHSSTNNVSYITGSSLKPRSSLKSKKKRNHQSSISSSSTESICAKLSDYYKEYNSNDRWAYQNHENHYYPYQAPTHNDYQKSVYPVEEEKEKENENDDDDNKSISSNSSISSYLSSLSSDSSSATRIPTDNSSYNYNHNIFPYTTGMDIHAYY